MQLNPELYRLPAPASKKKSLKKKKEQRPETLSIARPRPATSTTAAAAGHSSSSSSSTVTNNSQVGSSTRVYPKQQQQQATAYFPVATQQATINFGQANAVRYHQARILPTNPYYGIQQQQQQQQQQHPGGANVDRSAPLPPAANINQSSDPFAINFPAVRRGKSESDKSPPVSSKKKMPPKRTISTIVENRSLLDTPMGEDRDIHPTLVSYDPNRAARGSKPTQPNFSELEKEFLN